MLRTTHMAKAYSDDLRRKLLEAQDAEEGILEDLAEWFRISVSWAYNVSAARTKTGEMEIERETTAVPRRMRNVGFIVKIVRLGADFARPACFFVRPDRNVRPHAPESAAPIPF